MPLTANVFMLLESCSASLNQLSGMSVGILELIGIKFWPSISHVEMDRQGPSYIARTEHSLW